MCSMKQVFFFPSESVAPGKINEVNILERNCPALYENGQWDGSHSPRTRPCEWAVLGLGVCTSGIHDSEPRGTEGKGTSRSSLSPVVRLCPWSTDRTVPLQLVFPLAPALRPEPPLARPDLQQLRHHNALSHWPDFHVSALESEVKPARVCG